MKKAIRVSLLAATTLALSVDAQASGVDGVGVGVNYGLFAGPTFELNYAINNQLQIRGALSSGMTLSETTKDTDIEYDVESDGGINRLALDYHPFGGSFFLSAGYAVNNFKLSALGTTSAGQSVTIGDTTYDVDANVALNGQLDWDNGATLSLGWGHSPAKGWGAMVEIGAIFTGTPTVSLSGTGTVDANDGNGPQDVSSSQLVQDALNKEADKIQKDVGDYTFLPILQAGVTYRF
ncbi:hypothetical protein [Thiomicrorhabdus sp.]|uniref:hypothetical protein n=1 Tax=Thiomicrorhabdus sp. TaxID=2039724 RepID=UPI00356724BB